MHGSFLEENVACVYDSPTDIQKLLQDEEDLHLRGWLANFSLLKVIVIRVFAQPPPVSTI